ncbi:MAG: hypothetical protein WCD70_08840 [Alphaproteobacteria bacterium]
MKARSQPWIYSAFLDSTFILAPAFLISAVVLVWQDSITGIETIPAWVWGGIIIGVDVSHVYATLFRTYADPQERAAHATLYTLTPLVCWVLGVIIYSFSSLWFWHCLAYVAVFHFIRQQYGFMMIYGRRDQEAKTARALDKMAIYAATLYPLIYWHTHQPRNFDWFIGGDFFSVTVPYLSEISFVGYIAILTAYIFKEGYAALSTKSFNLPKNAILLGTAVSWFIGIVYLNNDLAFTTTNIIAHGIPYIALIWIYGRNRGQQTEKAALFGKIPFRRFFTISFIPVFIASLLLLAYFEEGLWDAFIWNEHKMAFRFFQALPEIEDKNLLSWLVPLLALPQMTHYALDAFIWKIRQQGTPWKEILFYRTRTS